MNMYSIKAIFIASEIYVSILLSAIYSERS